MISAIDKHRVLWGFACQAIFTSCSPQYCLCLCLESIMKLYRTSKRNYTASINKYWSSAATCFSAETSSATHLHWVNYLYRGPTSCTWTGLCVYCSSQTGAVILFLPRHGATDCFFSHTMAEFIPTQFCGVPFSEQQSHSLVLLSLCFSRYFTTA